MSTVEYGGAWLLSRLLSSPSALEESSEQEAVEEDGSAGFVAAGGDTIFTMGDIQNEAREARAEGSFGGDDGLDASSIEGLSRYTALKKKETDHIAMMQPGLQAGNGNSNGTRPDSLEIVPEEDSGDGIINAYVDFNVRSRSYRIFRTSDFSWREHAYSAANR
jgi:hypothetical protein